jgi:hypothetical protein
MSSQTIQWENTIGGNDTEWVDFIEYQKMRIIFWEAIHTLFLVIRMKIERSSDYWFIKIDDFW